MIRKYKHIWKMTHFIILKKMRINTMRLEIFKRTRYN